MENITGEMEVSEPESVIPQYLQLLALCISLLVRRVRMYAGKYFLWHLDHSSN